MGHADSHLAVFAAEAETDGGLSNTSRWDEAAEAVAMASAYGVRVHLCVINFDTDELGTLLGSSSARARLIEELEDENAWIPIIAPKGATSWTLDQIRAFFDDGVEPVRGTHQSFHHRLHLDHNHH